MAIRDRGANGEPVFEDAEVRCLQLSVLVATLDNGEIHEVRTYQNDSEWGLILRAADAASDTVGGIHRLRRLAELPTGQVSSADIRQSRAGDIGEVTLLVDDQPVLLMAGEIYETVTDRLEFHVADESVLVFPHPSDANAIAWIGERASAAAADDDDDDDEQQ
jgi:hypothetical protein